MRIKSVFLAMSTHGGDSADIRSNKLYTLARNDSTSDIVMVEPTAHFCELSPSEAIAELRAHVEGSFEKLRPYVEGNQDNPENLDKAYHLLFELEGAKQFLNHIRQGFAKKGYSVK